MSLDLEANTRRTALTEQMTTAMDEAQTAVVQAQQALELAEEFLLEVLKLTTAPNYDPALCVSYVRDLTRWYYKRQGTEPPEYDHERGGWKESHDRQDQHSQTTDQVRD